MLAGRQPRNPVDVSRGLGLLDTARGPASTYAALSLFLCPSLPSLEIAVVYQPGPERGPYDLALWQVLALARGLEPPGEVGLEEVTPQDLTRHSTSVTYTLSICQAYLFDITCGPRTPVRWGAGAACAVGVSA